MITDEELYQSLARLCELKTMNATKPRNPVQLDLRARTRPLYKRTADEQAQLDRIAEQFKTLEHGE